MMVVTPGTLRPSPSLYPPLGCGNQLSVFLLGGGVLLDRVINQRPELGRKIAAWVVTIRNPNFQAIRELDREGVGRFHFSSPWVFLIHGIRSAAFTPSAPASASSVFSEGETLPFSTRSMCWRVTPTL